jgi:hypothetical protein
MEIGNVPPTCGIPISQRLRPHLRKIAGRLCYFAGPENSQLHGKAKQI